MSKTQRLTSIKGGKYNWFVKKEKYGDTRYLPDSDIMSAGTTEQVDNVLCNKHTRAKQQTLQSLQCHIA